MLEEGVFDPPVHNKGAAISFKGKVRKQLNKLIAASETNIK